MGGKEHSGIPRECSLKSEEHLSAYICREHQWGENEGRNKINLFPYWKKLTVTPCSGSSSGAAIVPAGRGTVLKMGRSSWPALQR